MDCVDCHNRATHIYQDPEDALDAALAAGRISRALPFAKKVTLGALLTDYPDAEAAHVGIGNAVRGHYRRRHPEASTSVTDEIDAMVGTLREIRARNIHPGMNIGWNAYPSHLGHRRGLGCARCHNPDMVDADGEAVPYGCTLCHSILADDSPSPFRFLEPADEKDPDYRRHLWLQADFLKGDAD